MDKARKDEIDHLIGYLVKGNKAKAIEHYEKFLNLWKETDAGIAEDAKKRLAGVKN
jgi:DNA-binding SARP family transcriptional activator